MTLLAAVFEPLKPRFALAACPPDSKTAPAAAVAPLTIRNYGVSTLDAASIARRAAK